MKDIIDFPIVGSNYIPGANDFIKTLKEGTPIELRQDDHNQFDPDAIRIYIDGKHVGYVPNRGISCGRCWSHVSGDHQGICPHCLASWDEFVQGGLATRLKGRKVLESEHGCYIKEIQGSDKLSVTATIVIG